MEPDNVPASNRLSGFALDGGLHVPGLPDPDPHPLEPWLAATDFLDHDDPAIRSFVELLTDGVREPRDQAVRLFYAVRDRIRYDPYRISPHPDDYRASRILSAGHGWCVPKAVLLAAAARAAGIPSAIGLADVVNHMNTEKLRRRMGGTDVFHDHGYAALLIDGRWVKVVPAFNIELCERFGVAPTEFDGTADALYQEFDADNRRRMAYLADHGVWSDLPLGKVREDFARHYPPDLYEVPGPRDLPVERNGDVVTKTLAQRFEDESPLR